MNLSTNDVEEPLNGPIAKGRLHEATLFQPKLSLAEQETVSDDRLQETNRVVLLKTLILCDQNLFNRRRF